MQRQVSRSQVSLFPNHLVLRTAAALVLAASTASAQVLPFGTASPSSDGVVPTLDPPSAIYYGGFVPLELTGPPNATGWVLLGLSRETWLGLPLPLDLTLFGPSLFDGTLLVSTEVVLPVTFDADGHAQSQFFNYPNDISFFGQLLTSDPAAGQIAGATSLGWSFTPQPDVAITGLSTTTASPGSALDVFATDLPAEAIDLCILGRDPSGSVAAFMTPEAIVAGAANADVAAIAPGASEAFVTVMTGQSRYVAEGFAPPGIDYGPEDIRIWTSNGTPAEQFPVPITLQPSPGDACTEYYNGCVNPASGAIEIEIPGSAICPANTRFELQIDAQATNTMFDGGTFFDYVSQQGNTTPLPTADCAIAACTVFQLAFLEQHGVLVFCNTSTDAKGNVTIAVSPPFGDTWGSGSCASFRICD
ncbi:MAG: hypothetical protein AAF682_32245 [Planctomycetota bacterium]